MTKEKRELYYSVGNVFIQLIKWFSLILCVLYSGFTIVLLLISLVNADMMDPNALASFGSYITHIDSSSVFDLIVDHGTINAEVSIIGYGIGMSITYIIIYYICKQFLSVYYDMCIGNMYTKKNVKIINECTELSFLLTFTMPLIILTINLVTGVFSNYSSLDFSGIIFLLGFLLLKLIFANGIQLQAVISDYEKMNYEKEVDRNETRMEEVKKKQQIAKKVVKKEEAKKEEAKKEVKKSPAKKAVKKTTTKKTTKK